MRKIRQIREQHGLIVEKENEKLDKKIPFMIILKRKSIRQFGDGQTVGLYHSQALDRYVSIPFGNKAEPVITEDKSMDAFLAQHIAKGGSITDDKGNKLQGQEALDYVSQKPKIKAKVTQPQPVQSQPEPIQKPASVQPSAGKVTASYGTQTPYKPYKTTYTQKPAAQAQEPEPTQKDKKSSVIPKHHIQNYINLMSSGKEKEARNFADSLHDTYKRSSIRQMARDAEPHIEKAKLEKSKGLSPTIGALHQAGMPAMYAPVAAAGWAAGKAAQLVGKGIIGGAKKLFKEETIKEKFDRKIKEKKQVEEDTFNPSSPTFLAPVTSSVAGDIPTNLAQKKQNLKKLQQKTVSDRQEIQKKVEAGDIEGAEKHAKENPAVIPPKEVKQSLEKATPEDVTNRMAGAERTSWALLAALGARGASAAATAAASLAALGSKDEQTGSGSGTPSTKSNSYQAPPIEVGKIKPTFSKPQRITPGGSDIATQAATNKRIWKNVSESIIDQLKELATKTDLSKDILFVNEEKININNNIAEKVLTVYESLNKTNRKKFEKMLGESKKSFREAVNFALRY
jgi:hypothetical protein